MKLYPCPFNVGDRRTFKNKHGEVTLEVVSPAAPVSTFYRKDAPEECLIDFDTAEQIELITDGVRLAAVFDWVGMIETGKDSKGAYVLHDTTKTCGWVKVVSLNYTNPVPAKDQIAQDMDNGRNRVHVNGNGAIYVGGTRVK